MRIRMPSRPKFDLSKYLSPIPEIASKEREFNCSLCRVVNGNYDDHMHHVISQIHRDKYLVLAANGGLSYSNLQ